MIGRVGVCVSAVALLAGCGGAELGYDAANLSGAVTIDGKPAPDGTLTFIPGDSGPTTGAPIIGGRYEAENVPKGKATVQFAIGTLAPNPKDPHGQVFTSLVPPKYAKGIEIDVAGDNDAQNFDLTSQ